MMTLVTLCVMVLFPSVLLSSPSPPVLTFSSSFNSRSFESPSTTRPPPKNIRNDERPSDSQVEYTQSLPRIIPRRSESECNYDVNVTSRSWKKVAEVERMNIDLYFFPLEGFESVAVILTVNNGVESVEFKKDKLGIDELRLYKLSVSVYHDKDRIDKWSFRVKVDSSPPVSQRGSYLYYLNWFWSIVVKAKGNSRWKYSAPNTECLTSTNMTYSTAGTDSPLPTPQLPPLPTPQLPSLPTPQLPSLPHDGSLHSPDPIKYILIGVFSVAAFIFIILIILCLRRLSRPIYDLGSRTNKRMTG
ncbi:uncharacterized protein LOC121872452 isoform X2 [Homarus americanus]|uniref:uncharacterized protein LOC121872452 isoform X2 n=1 Tax=Homarus americanus TaxID=6706 RepID=UPI001C45F07C|nr:uncharacterized protein LOC121872452 isoform X2 [Homarus americanus]